MYEEYFGLQDRPFLSEPHCDRFFPAEIAQSARQTLARTIQRGEGAGLIIGPAGTGKTLLCRVLAHQFRQRFVVVMLCGGQFRTAQALFQAILYDLGLPYRGLDEGELRLSLVDFLCHSSERPEAMLLLVDEAHTLPSRVLEEIRMTMNWVSDGQPSSRVVLAGAPALEERLTSPKLEALNQRIVARCYLEAFDRATTAAYIESMIEQAGGQADELFPPDARETVYRATDGVPRLINQLCDHALVLACAAGKRSIDSQLVEEAWADLQQLPAPWNESPSENEPQQVVEFGTWDEETPESPAEETEVVASEGSSEGALVEFSPQCDSPPEAGAAPAEVPAEEQLPVATSESPGATPEAPGADTSSEADPCGTLEQVQQVLAAIEQGPPASSSSLSESSGALVPDPFSETFDEEEVVADTNAFLPQDEPLAACSAEAPAAETPTSGEDVDSPVQHIAQDDSAEADSVETDSAAIVSFVQASEEELQTDSAPSEMAAENAQPTEAAEGSDEAADSLDPAAEQVVIEFGQPDELPDDTSPAEAPDTLPAEAPGASEAPEAPATTTPAPWVPAAESPEHDDEVVALPIYRADEAAAATLGSPDTLPPRREAPSESVTLHRVDVDPAPPEADRPDDDRDIISIEETADDEPDHRTRPAVCRRQYRQLFARLRRGEPATSS